MTREEREEIKKFENNLNHYVKITNSITINKSVLNNPEGREGRNESILEIAKESVQTMEEATTELAKEITFLLYKMKQEGFTIKFVK